LAAPWAAWATGYGATGSVDGDGNSHRLDETIGGGAIGLDGRVAPGLMVGLGLGYASTSLGVNDGGGQGDVDAVQAGLYASWAGGDGFYADGAVGYAHGSNSLSRDVSLPGLPGTAKGSAGANQFLAAAEVGDAQAVAPATVVTPFLRLDAATFSQNGLTESGGGAADLAVERVTASSVQSLAGARLDHTLVVGGTLLAGQLELGWAHEYVNPDRTVTASFAAAPGSSFTVDGAKPARDAARVGAGVAAAVTADASLYLRYEGDLSGSGTTHAVTGGLRLTW
jgi:outer membrane autotransporter protein